jgi:hypothetical protein
MSKILLTLALPHPQPTPENPHPKVKPQLVLSTNNLHAIQISNKGVKLGNANLNGGFKRFEYAVGGGRDRTKLSLVVNTSVPLPHVTWALPVPLPAVRFPRVLMRKAVKAGAAGVAGDKGRDRRRTRSEERVGRRARDDDGGMGWGERLIGDGRHAKHDDEASGRTHHRPGYNRRTSSLDRFELAERRRRREDEHFSEDGFAYGYGDRASGSGKSDRSIDSGYGSGTPREGRRRYGRDRDEDRRSRYSGDHDRRRVRYSDEDDKRSRHGGSDRRSRYTDRDGRHRRHGSRYYDRKGGRRNGKDEGTIIDADDNDGDGIAGWDDVDIGDVDVGDAGGD